MRTALVFLSVFIYSICYGGTIDPSVPDDRYTKYGEEHKSVVKIFGKCFCKKEGCKEHDFAASAVVIKPKWIITAAHVVDKTKDVKIKVRDKEYKIKRIIIKDGFDQDKIGLNDIALGYSDSDFEMEFYPEMYSKKDETGKVASMCGYGLTGNFSTGATKSDGLKRAGSNIIERTEGSCLICTNTGGRKTSLEFLIASGDSGGGLFIDGKLAGINSFVMAIDKKPNSDYGDESAHTRISEFLGWIKENTEKDQD